MNVDEEFKRIAAESTATLAPYLRRNVENFYRVGSLVGASARHGNEDLLRAAVVFLHATLEDCLRSIAAAFLPNADETVLNRIPLTGSSTFRPEKFWLGRLSTFREKTVAELIKLSIDDYLARVSFSSASEIAEHLQPLGFEISPLKIHFPMLNEMMRRRHQIVHRADRDDKGDLVAIAQNEVLKWVDAVTKFLSNVLAQAGNKEAFVRIEHLLLEIARERGIEL
ncbi:MAG: HEPN domain-containing protein [Chthoniobacterales bacterium]